MSSGSAVAVLCDLRGCDNPLPKGRRKYCSDRCRNTANNRKYRARKRGVRSVEDLPKPVNTPGRVEVTSDGRVSARRPPDHFIEGDWFHQIAEGIVTQAQAARSLETTEANVSRWFEWCKREAMVAQAAEDWTMPPEARRALNDFRYFRERYFKIARGPKAIKGKPPATTEYHARWIAAILRNLPEESGGDGREGEGGQLAICCPPRHGKSLLLAHVTIWLILRNPDICILWSGPSDNIARRFGSLVRDELETNELLIEEFLGPGGTFRPEARSGMQWRDDEFEVATRTTPQPAPTLKCVGKTGRILSMDVDLMIADDLEDQESTSTPAGRERTRERFFTDLASRKEEHTAWVYIGSRQHPDDLLGHLIDSEEWEVIVETAHDPACELPVDDEDAHDDCVLWPGVRTYRYLMQKLRTVGDRIFQMQYLSDPSAGNITIFTEAQMRDAGVLDRSRSFGQLDLPAGYELLGSIDPSPGVHQVAELWAWSRSNPTRYLIDMPSMRGGMDAWEDLVWTWLEKYQLRRWVVEDNALQSDYINRREFKQRCHDEGVFVEGVTTGVNKHSLGIGVASMVPLYANKHIVLPYGDAETRGKVDAFIREHVNYDPDRRQRDTKWRIDRVMAAWLAHLKIDTLQGGRIDSDARDSTPDWMTPAGIDWIENDGLEDLL